MDHHLVSHRSKLVLGLIILCIAGLALMCSDNKPNCAPEGQPGWEPATRNALLDCLCHAYEERDINAYADLLHDRFIFSFVPEIAESIGLPAGEPWWGKTEDIASTRNLFDSEIVIGIQMRLDEPVWFPCQVIRLSREPSAPDTLEGFCTRVEPDIRVSIMEPGGEELMLTVDRTWLDIAVVPNPHQEGLWQIITIEESLIPPEAAGGLSKLRMLTTPPVTWSYIKSVFR